MSALNVDAERFFDCNQPLFVFSLAAENEGSPATDSIRHLAGLLEPRGLVVYDAYVAANDPGDLDRLASGMADRFGLCPPIGVSEACVNTCLLDISLEHAEFAATWAQSNEKPYARFSECSFEFFSSLVGLDEHFPALQNQRVARLYETDCERGTDLLRTLVVYIESGFSLSLCSSALGIHRNSVLYRLNRIEEHSGINLLGSPNGLDVFMLLLSAKAYLKKLSRDSVPIGWIPEC